MSDRTRVRVGRTMAAIAVVAAVVGTLWLAVMSGPRAVWFGYVAHNALVAVGFGVMAWLVLPTQPRNGAVWVAAWAGLLSGLVPLLSAVAAWAAPGGIVAVAPEDALRPVDVPLWLALVGQQVSWSWMGVLLIPTLLFLRFPDGRLPSRRWRPLGWAVSGLWLLAVLGLIWGTRPSSILTYAEVQEVVFDGQWSQIVFSVAYLGLFATFPFCAAALVVRSRRAEGLERQQFRWMTWGAALAAPLLIVAVVFEVRGEVGVTLGLLAVVIVLFVVPMGVAIGRYRLYDVDVVISRTVVFAVLAGFVGLVYATVVVGLGSWIGAAGEGWAPILATAAVALAFEPVRQVAQRWANRLAYGHRATPYEVLSDVTARLAGSAGPDELLGRMADLVVAGTGAERATVWLGSPGAMRPVATSGSGDPPDAGADLSADTVFTVEHDGETVGALEVVAPRGGRLSTQERALLGDLAGSAGAVLGHQRLNESLATKARELDRSRRRLVEAEDQELRRLERELDEGAQQQVLAIKVKLILVERLAAEQGADRLATLLAGLVDEAQAALDEVRRLAKGIYPPVLASDGLGPALSALAAGTPVPVEVHGDGVGRYPPDVEAAVYFDVAEAMTNAIKHATPPIRVELGERDGLLAFAVTDTGPGFDPASVEAGSGLANLSDRLDAVGGRVWVRSAPGAGTTVAGEVPLGRAATPVR